ncbi:GNAT family N-acetyltransferase [Caulobacter sp. KR2-114]|uniref:GNAT family N-acetyltransferase n=1 Tax=Caulobacter sp. KR2-114 TaxID=3400912 RepID=UPI003C1274A4
MSAPPKTRLEVSAAEAEAIRTAVRCASPDWNGAAAGGRSLATEADIDALTDLLGDPAVSGPVYDLPRPITRETIGAWVRDCLAARERGEALLLVTRDAEGQVSGYSKITIWPDRSAAELAGAIRADRQSVGQGGAGAWRTIDWMFAALGVRLICLTAALDNIRSARLIEAMGFVRQGDRDAVGEDGSVRPSLYWEMTREAWRGVG